MSRITVVLFHLVLTASVTVWANSERQLAQVGEESQEGAVVSEQPNSEQPNGSNAGEPPNSERVTTSGASTNSDQSSTIAPSI